MELLEAMRTTFSCRDFTDEPVTDDQLHRILDAARFAPSGGNRDLSTTYNLRLIGRGNSTGYHKIVSGCLKWGRYEDAENR